MIWFDWFDFWCFNATFNNISAIVMATILVVEKAGENHRPWAASRVHLFCNLQSRGQTHAVLVIGLYIRNIVESGVKTPKIKSIKSDHLLYNSSIFCTIHLLYNSSTIHVLYNFSTIHLLYNSSTIHLLYNSSTIHLLYNSSTIHLLYNSSTIHLLYNSSTIHLLYNSSTIHLLYNSSTITLLYNY
jgi:hypothetical protein